MIKGLQIIVQKYMMCKVIPGKNYQKHQYLEIIIIVHYYLLDGSILVSGGDTWSSEIYYPPYLFEKNNEGTTVFAKKPKISNIKKNYIIGDDIQFTSDSKISGISLISAGSTTHSQGVELKYFDLKFEKKDSDIFAKLPKNRKTLQKGV